MKRCMPWSSIFVLMMISLMGLWFMLIPWGLPVYGEFWSWILLFAGFYLFSINVSRGRGVGAFIPATIVTLLGVYSLCRDLGIKYFSYDQIFYFFVFLVPMIIILSQFSRKKESKDVLPPSDSE